MSRMEEHNHHEYKKLHGQISLDELKSFLWGAATRLRGQIDAAGYKEYIFPLRGLYPPTERPLIQLASLNACSLWV